MGRELHFAGHWGPWARIFYCLRQQLCRAHTSLLTVFVALAVGCLVGSLGPASKLFAFFGGVIGRVRQECAGEGRRRGCLRQRRCWLFSVPNLWTRRAAQEGPTSRQLKSRIETAARRDGRRCRQQTDLCTSPRAPERQLRDYHGTGLLPDHPG
ncbi:hypothetical protein HDK77DRAFT_48634 [Phyllosticta capitalensis]